MLEKALRQVVFSSPLEKRLYRAAKFNGDVFLTGAMQQS